MAFDRQAAKQAGYSDEEIDAYLQSQPKQEKPDGPVAPGATTETSTEPPPPSTVIGETGGIMPAVATAGMAVAPYVVPAALAGAGLYGATKIGGWANELGKTAREGMEAYKYGVNANTTMAQENASLQRERMLERMARGGDVAAKAELDALQQARNARVMPGSTAQAGQQAFNQMGQQLARGPVAPAPQAPASMASRVQQAAASKIANLPPALGTAGKFAGRVLPGVATAVNAADTYNRFNQGDYTGAALSGLGTVASPFPVVGTAIGLGTAGINAYRDANKKRSNSQ